MERLFFSDIPLDDAGSKFYFEVAGLGDLVFEYADLVLESDRKVKEMHVKSGLLTIERGFRTSAGKN